MTTHGSASAGSRPATSTPSDTEVHVIGQASVQLHLAFAVAQPGLDGREVAEVGDDGLAELQHPVAGQDEQRDVRRDRRRSVGQDTRGCVLVHGSQPGRNGDDPSGPEVTVPW